MVDYNLIKDLEDDALASSALLTEAEEIGAEMDQFLGEDVSEFTRGTILKGKVVGFAGDDVVLDVGFKSEGLVNKGEFDDFDQIKPGDEFEVLLEAIEAENGEIALSKRKADRIRGWERIISENEEGDVVEGKVMRKIKGGLLVDIGVPVFLPASQVDIRRPADIGDYIGKSIQAKILKIDTERRNIVISRRKLVEEDRAEKREKLLSTLNEGDLVQGVVKNIADFGAFVDIGGLDGLLHVTDMSWGRVNHPSEMLSINDKIEVKVLNIDREKEKIALGLKQREVNPWEEIESKYPVGSRVKGEVVNIVSYGSFVKLEDGIEGLVHISEMSWTRRVNHPSEIVAMGDEVEVVVLDINKDKQEISLGMKQAEANPWDTVAEKYPPGTVIEGTVRNLTNYGAFVEIEPGIDGMLHVSDLSWTKKVAHPNEVLKKSDKVNCVVLEVDQDKQRVSLGVKQLSEDPWIEAIPTHYQPGMVVHGQVTKITNFGVFVELEDDLEGLLHISELSEEKIENPQDVVKVGQDLEVKILRVDIEERKIGLSLKRAQAGADTAEALEQANRPDRPRPARGGMDADASILGTDKISFGPGGAKGAGGEREED
ncbi:30S ribosomal protein S1 [Planctomycetales bacterium ZRK34]|nr:30S ribosomal protein S1 [Planctomycetales bacterium ZRK34]